MHKKLNYVDDNVKMSLKVHVTIVFVIIIIIIVSFYESRQIREEH